MFSRLLLPFVVLFFAVTSLAQGDLEWVRLSAGDGEIEVSGPPNGIVLHQEETSRVAMDLPDAWFVISADRRTNAKLFINNIKSSKKDRVFVETRRIGDALVKIQIRDWEKVYSVEVHIAGEDDAYQISAVAATKDNESLRRFLGSIRISGRVAFPDLLSASRAAPGEVLPIEKLRISPMVLASLKKPDASPSAAKFAKIERLDEGFDMGYSRRLFVVQKPRANFTSEARSNGKQGTITAKVEFRSDGTIGAFTVDPTIDKGLAQNVAKAVSMIKFVPAEKDGAPVTVSKYVSYSFTIY